MKLYERRKEVKISFDTFIVEPGIQFDNGRHNPDASLARIRNGKLKVFDCMFHVCIEGFHNEYYFSENLLTA